ncbi:MAG: histidinol-phosphatase HisJ family protein [Promethearchaeota archaeon]|nr:MAG: histidinol-phosphatase HisJ family protein [Candidatus Lokiarchaeota archaeon]
MNSLKFKYTDYHVHTKWSHDIAKIGPSFEDYARIAEKNKINICFLDHYELYYIENDNNYPFYEGKIIQYLDEIDKIKEVYDCVLSGLEVDYYLDYENQLKEFMDDYEKQFDFIAGTLHEPYIGLPVTTRIKLAELLEKKHVKEVVDNFFKLSKKMIESKIFKNICHLDTIFRYINTKDFIPSFDTDVSDERVLNLGRLCIKNNLNIEYNLSGLKFPIGRPFPSKSVITQLKKEGANIFVGSDSHSINYFRTAIPKVKKAYKFLKKV